MNTNQNTPTNTNEIDITDVDGREDETSTTESVFGFTPEEAREFDAMPHVFHNTEEELLNFFSPEEETTNRKGI